MLISNQDVINVLKQNNININGVFHLGAHECEEINFYNELGVSPQNIVWIDALEEKVMLNKSRGIPNVYHAVVSDEDDKEIVFHVSNNYQSSSILEFGTHSKEHPWVFYTREIPQKTITINTFFDKNNIDGTKYDFWNFDIQGAELLALKGATKYIPYVKAMYLEVNERELYKNCGLIDEMDNFLASYGFERILTHMTEYGWGDALYIKK